MNEPIIYTQYLSRRYPLEGQQVVALDEVSFEIEAGQFVAIMGPSGSGKSTLLYLLGGLDRPTDGHIVIAEQQIDTMSTEELAQFRQQNLGFVFQAFHLIPTMTALENVGLPGLFAQMPVDEREERAFRLLDMLGMAERIEHRPKQLSGGQQQRVAIARALFNDPPIIMADEPTGALDSKTGLTVLRMLRTLCDKRGKTVIVVTHDPSIARFADRLITLRDGRIIGDRLIEHA